MSKKLTAIEFAAKKMKEDIHIYGGEGWDVLEEVLIILHEALEMEQDQIEDAYAEGMYCETREDLMSPKSYFKSIYQQPIITITTKPDNDGTTESNT